MNKDMVIARLLPLAAVIGFVLLFAGCAPMELSAPKYGGESRDILKEDMAFEVESAGDTLTVTISPVSGGACKGTFKHAETKKAMLWFTSAIQRYEGSFSAGQGAACQKAIGSDGGEELVLKLTQSVSIFGMSSVWAIICEQKGFLCIGRASFSFAEEE